MKEEVNLNNAEDFKIPIYDDLVRNKILHPDGGVAMSYRYDFIII